MLSLQIFLYKYYTCAHSIVIIFFLLPLPLKFLQHFSQPFLPMWNFIVLLFLSHPQENCHPLLYRPSFQSQAGSHDTLYYPH